MKQITNFIFDNWELIAPVIFEIIVRVVPTKNNWSIIHNAVKIIDMIIKNKRAETGNEQWVKVNDKGELINQISVPVNKHIIMSLLLFVTIACNAQNPNNKFTAIYSNATDTVFIQSTRNALQLSQGNTAALYYDETRDKWRVWQDSVYFDLLGWATGQGDFWPLAGNGTLTDDVTIDVDNNDLSIIRGNAGIQLRDDGLDEAVITGDRVQIGASNVEIELGNSTVNVTAGTDVIFAVSETSIDFTADGASSRLSLQTNVLTAEGLDIHLNTGSSLFFDLYPANRVLYTTTAGEIITEAGFEYNGTSNLFSVPNATISTLLNPSYIPGTYVVYKNAASTGVVGEANFTYNETTNSLSVTNGSGTNNRLVGNSSLGGYEITSGTRTTNYDLNGLSFANPGGSAGSEYQFSSSGAATSSGFRFSSDVTLIFRLSGLPTSSAGLVSGMVWNNAGVLNIIP